LYLALGTVAAAASTAHGAPTASIEPPVPDALIEPRPVPEPEVDWEHAPRPDQASGVAREDATPVSRQLLWIPRGILFLPRWTVWLAAQPVRGAAYTYERYALPAWFKRTLFTVDQQFGVYPTVAYESEYGVNGGLRLVHRNLFGAGERLKVGASVGGRYRRTAQLALRSGRRFGDRIAVELDARYERRSDRFYGFGNGDRSDSLPEMPIDPTFDGPAYETRFREDLDRVVAIADVKLAEPVHARVSAAWMSRDFLSASNSDDDAPIGQVYDVGQLAGFSEGIDTLYGEAELAYDTRRPTSDYQSQTLEATGWRVAGFAGAATGLGGDPTDYVRYGGEILRLFDLYAGSRVLVLRVLAEAIAGTDGRTDREIAFVELPKLGGNEDLRGYPTNRFRDRAILLGSAEYRWDLGTFTAAYLFTDAGRALPSLADATLDRLRVGFGGGIQFHTRDSFLLRTQLAGSRDGDLFFELVLQPSFGRRERAGRY
jgi:hypothetical protein